jgi:hypothetical protein
MLTPSEVAETGALIGYSLAELPVEHASILLNGTVANIVGHLPEEHWQKMLAISGKPCGKPDCQCHLQHGALFAALQTLREEWKKVVNEETNLPDEKGFAE